LYVLSGFKDLWEKSDLQKGLLGKVRFTKRTFGKSQIYKKDFGEKSDLQKGLLEKVRFTKRTFGKSKIHKKDYFQHPETPSDLKHQETKICMKNRECL
jgi:hypothetical protein